MREAAEDDLWLLMKRKTARSRPRFPGLHLPKRDRQALAKLKRKQLSERIWRRIRMLELLHRGWNLTVTGEAVGTYPREVRRVGWRYLERGLDAALSDEPRPKPEKMLDTRQQSAIVAMVCGPPPEGYARWSVRLATKEAMRQGIVAKVGRETVRRVFADHDFKPWREKNVVRAEARQGLHQAHGGRSEPVGTPPK